MIDSRCLFAPLSAEKRWEFLVVASPLRLPRGTGSLFNPIIIYQRFRKMPQSGIREIAI
jgi:hypothetical protein